MKLKDLLEVCDGYDRIELHSSYGGRIVASTRDSLKKYGEVDVRGVYPRVKLNTEGTLATPYLHIYGSHYQINEVKKNA